MRDEKVGNEDTFLSAVRRLASQDTTALSQRRFPKLDTLIGDAGPWSVAHTFTLLRQGERDVLRTYLRAWWPTYLNFSDQMRVATHWRRENAADLTRDFGQG